MIASMTGYGKSECQIGKNKVTIEIRSLNSKQLDINTRLPGTLKEKDMEIRSLLTKQLIRGKIDFIIMVDENADLVSYTLNQKLAKKYHSELRKLASDLGENDFDEFIPLLVRMPEIFIPEKTELSKKEWKESLLSIEAAIEQVVKSRAGEGSVLERDFAHRIAEISRLLGEIPQFEQTRINKLRSKVINDLNQLIDEKKIDKNRFEQELIYYVEKFDFTEEKVRLAKHCDYFTETMEESKSNGKKLNFISQEIGREINTLGSKAFDADIQRIVVQMKDELEKIKEQLFNIL